MLNEKDLEKMSDAREVVKACEEFRRNYNFEPDRKDFPYPKVGDVIDENKSVKWNREEIERLRAAFDAEKKRLDREYYRVSNLCEKKAEELLAEEYELSEDETRIVWGKACEDGHNYGIVEVYNIFVNLVDYFVRFKRAKKRGK